MPHTASAKKRLRQNEKRKLHNRSAKHSVKTQVRKVQDAIGKNDLTTATQEFQLACKKLDKAAARHLLHPNAVSRKKSRLAKSLAGLSRSAPGAES